MAIFGRARGKTELYRTNERIGTEIYIREYYLTGGEHIIWMPEIYYVRTIEERATLTDAYLRTKKMYLKDCVYGRERSSFKKEKRTWR